MEASEPRASVEENREGPLGFVARIEAEARSEAGRVLEELTRLRFEAHQVVRVLKALNLEVPADLDALVRGVPVETALKAAETPAKALDEPRAGSTPPVATAAPEMEPEARERASEPELEPAPEPESVSPPRRIITTKDGVTRSVPTHPGIDAVPEELRHLPAAQRGGPLKQRLETARGQARVLGVVEDGRKTVISGEIHDVLPDIPQARVSDYLRDLERASLIQRTGKNRRPAGVMMGRASVEYRALVTPQSATPEAEEKVAPEQLAAVRDEVCSRRSAFAPAELVEATGLPEDVVRASLVTLMQRGRSIHYVGFDDMELYEYVPPKEPGKGAELDAARRKAESAAMSTNGGGGGAPVSGIGRPKATVKWVDDILAKADKAGAKIQKTGSGHFRITNPENNRSVVVYATPGAPSIDKTRKKLAGIGLEV